MEREVLSWFDAQGQRYLSAEERAQQERRARLAAIAQLHQTGLSAEQIAQALSLSLDVVNQQLSS